MDAARRSDGLVGLITSTQPVIIWAGFQSGEARMTAAVEVLAGERFGRLVVLGEADPALSGGQARRRLRVRCDCGTERVVRLEALRRKVPTRSCGCLQRERTSAIGSRTVHGHGSARRGLSPTYLSWASMKCRCYQPTCSGFEHYGGRGITVCDRWLDGAQGFVNFLADMGERPDGHTLDRLDNDGNYEPANCRWATRSDQNRNRRHRA